MLLHIIVTLPTPFEWQGILFIELNRILVFITQVLSAFIILSNKIIVLHFKMEYLLVHSIDKYYHLHVCICIISKEKYF